MPERCDPPAAQGRCAADYASDSVESLAKVRVAGLGLVVRSKHCLARAHREVEPSLFYGPVVHGASMRLGLLRGEFVARDAVRGGLERRQ